MYSVSPAPLRIADSLSPGRHSYGVCWCLVVVRDNPPTYLTIDYVVGRLRHRAGRDHVSAAGTK